MKRKFLKNYSLIFTITKLDDNEKVIYSDKVELKELNSNKLKKEFSKYAKKNYRELIDDLQKAVTEGISVVSKAVSDYNNNNTIYIKENICSLDGKLSYKLVIYTKVKKITGLNKNATNNRGENIYEKRLKQIEEDRIKFKEITEMKNKLFDFMRKIEKDYRILKACKEKMIGGILPDTDIFGNNCFKIPMFLVIPYKSLILEVGLKEWQVSTSYKILNVKLESIIFQPGEEIRISDYEKYTFKYTKEEISKLKRFLSVL